MSEFDANQLDKMLRKRADFEAKGQNPPPELHLGALAAKYGISTAEILNKINELRQPKDQPT